MEIITGENQISLAEMGLIELGTEGTTAKQIVDMVEAGVAVVTVIGGTKVIATKSGEFLGQIPRAQASNRTFDFTTSGTGNDFRRTTQIDGRNVTFKSGYAYNRPHAGGDVPEIGTMDEIETSILNDITSGNRLDALPPRTTQKHTVEVNGQTLEYTLADTPVGPSINYYPLIE